MLSVRKIWVIVAVVALGIVLAAIIAALILGTEIRIERHVEVVGPDVPVYYMIVRGQSVTLIEQELEKNPQLVHEPVMNNSLLGYAADKGREDVVRLLLEMGADPDGLRRPGEDTPLMNAVFRGNERIAAILIEHGADPDLRGGLFLGSSPRQMAEEKGNQRMLSILAEAGNEDGGDGPGAPSGAPD